MTNQAGSSPRRSPPGSQPKPAASRHRHPVNLAFLNDNVRLFVSAAVAVLVQTLFDLPVRERIIAAWDVGAVLFLILTWWVILNTRTWSARRWIAAQDEPRSPAFALLFGPEANLVLAVAVSLVGVGAALALIGGDTSADEDLHRSLHALGVILAWLVLNTAFALYYIYLYFRADRQGLIFPAVGSAGPTDPDSEPDQLDFAYFAFTLATTFATSDVQIVDRTIRRTALGHSVLAFAYNTAILSVAVGFLTRF